MRIHEQSRLVSKAYEKPKNNGNIVFCRDSQAKSVSLRDNQSFGLKKHSKQAENSKKNRRQESCKKIQKAPSIIQDRAKAIQARPQVVKQVQDGQDRIQR